METSSNQVAESRIPRTDSEGNFLFRREWLADYKIIDGPMNKVELKVTSEPTLYKPNDDTSPRYIVNVKAILRSDLPVLKERFGSAAYIRANELNELFLSATVWVNDGVEPEVPMKGEMVTCTIGHVFSPAQGKEVLRITGIKVNPPAEAEKVDLDVLFSDAPAEEFGDPAELLNNFDKSAIETAEKLTK